MAARSALSKIAPSLVNARAASSLTARRAALARSYASQSGQTVRHILGPPGNLKSNQPYYEYACR